MIAPAAAFPPLWPGSTTTTLPSRGPWTVGGSRAGPPRAAGRMAVARTAGPARWEAAGIPVPAGPDGWDDALPQALASTARSRATTAGSAAFALAAFALAAFALAAFALAA